MFLLLPLLRLHHWSGRRWTGNSVYVEEGAQRLRGRGMDRRREGHGGRQEGGTWRGRGREERGAWTWGMETKTKGVEPTN